MSTEISLSPRSDSTELSPDSTELDNQDSLIIEFDAKTRANTVRANAI